MAPTFDFAFFDSEEHIDECEELDTKAMPYQPSKNPGKGAPPDFKNLDESDLFELLESGTHYWRTSEEIAYRRALEGAMPDDVTDEMREALDRVPPALQDDKWKKAGKSIKKWIARAFKRAAKANKKLRPGPRLAGLAKRDPQSRVVRGTSAERALANAGQSPAVAGASIQLPAVLVTRMDLPSGSFSP